MIAYGFFGHQDTDNNEPSPWERIVAAGFPSSAAGENIAAVGGSGADFDADSVKGMHINLFIDSNAANRGHRITILKDAHEAIGLDIQHTDAFAPFGDMKADVLTQDFSYHESIGPFLTGVAYDDADEDDFYSPGEGLADVTIIAFQAGTNTEEASTVSIATGGYVLALPAGSYDIIITGSLGTLTRDNLVIEDINIKLDYTSDTLIPSDDDPGDDPADDPTDDPSDDDPVEENPNLPVDAEDNGGCACGMTPYSSGSGPELLLLLSLGAFILRRRR